MYGAFIGDIIGSSYKQSMLKKKDFLFFSGGCGFTEESVMAAAVAKAIMLSHDDRYKNDNEKGFQPYVISEMQSFGKRYPNPKGGYGGRIAAWISSENPKPYGSFGCMAALRGVPCGLAAVTIEEAQKLAHISAAVTHNHKEGIKGTKAVACAVFMAKRGEKIDAIRKYIAENFYPVYKTLKEIRPSYKYDTTCMGCVPQALTAFFESIDFEDAIRNAVSLGGNCNTLSAIAASVAWVYYIKLNYGDSAWASYQFDGYIGQLRKRAYPYLPKEFMTIARDFHKFANQREAAYRQNGNALPILTEHENDVIKCPNESVVGAYSGTENDGIGKAMNIDEMRSSEKIEVTRFIQKYVILMKILHFDKELNFWCRNYFPAQENKEHQSMESNLYDGFVKEAYSLSVFKEYILYAENRGLNYEQALNGTDKQLAAYLMYEIKSDRSGSLISEAIAQGRIYKIMNNYLKK